MLKIKFLSQINKYLMLGFIAGIPLSIQVVSREVFVLYLLLFIPLSFSIIPFRTILATKLTPIDKVTGAYFLWAILGFLIYLVQILWLGGGGIGPRAGSMMATMCYAILPYFIGRLLCQSDKDIESLVDGLIAGMILGCGVLLFNYTLQWPVDLFQARYEIGQRIPMVIGFLTILNLSRKQSLKTLFAIMLLSTALIFLSETRVSIAAFALSLLLALLFCGREYGKNKILVVVIAAVLAGALTTQVSVGLRFRTNLMFTTIDVYSESHFRSVKSEPLKDEHLKDASMDMRLQIWKNILGKVIENPERIIFGYGQLGPSFIGDQLRYASGYVVEQYSAHNEYLDVAVRTGFVGLVLYFLVFGTVIFFAWMRKKSQVNPVSYLYFHMTFALVGVAFYGMFHETTRYPWFGVLFWMFVGILSARNATNLDGARTNMNLQQESTA